MKNHLTGRRSLIIPDLATAILSKDPPSAARWSVPMFVIIDAARSKLVSTLVASRAPPNPAYRLRKEVRTISIIGWWFAPFSRKHRLHQCLITKKEQNELEMKIKDMFSLRFETLFLIWQNENLSLFTISKFFCPKLNHNIQTPLDMIWPIP